MSARGVGQGFGRAVLAVAVVVALAAIYGLASIGHPTAAAERRGPAGRVDVSTAVRVCPAPGSAGPTSSSLAMSAMPTSAATGTAVVTPLIPAGSSSAPRVAATLRRPGVLQTATVPVAPPLTAAQQAGQPGSSPSVRTQPGRGGVLVSASGALAEGLAVEQIGLDGLVTAQCGAPGTNFWFVGPGREPAGLIELYLTNAGSQPADAQVQVLVNGANGPPVLGNADNGIDVPPHGMVVQSLSGLLQGSTVMAVNVSTTVGQVSAAVRESKFASQDGIWLPAVQAPARHLVIPGLPATPGPRHLYLAVPSAGAAQVKITAVSKHGSYQPTGGTGIELLGGSATDIPLPSLGGMTGAVSVTSSVPIVGAMLLPGGPGGTAGALAVSASRVQEEGVFAANPAGAAGKTQLVLSAPGKEASVRITTATAARSASGQTGQVVHIPAKSSVAVPVRPPGTANQFTVVVTPLAGSGPVYGGRVINAQGSVQSVLPAPSSLIWIPLPDVRESVGGILRN